MLQLGLKKLEKCICQDLGERVRISCVVMTQAKYEKLNIFETNIYEKHKILVIEPEYEG